MKRQEFVEALSKEYGLPPFAIEQANYNIVECNCGATHIKRVFGKGCPGWRCVLKSAKVLAKERATFNGDVAQAYSAKVRAWRKAHGYGATPAERGASA